MVAKPGPTAGRADPARTGPGRTGRREHPTTTPGRTGRTRLPGTSSCRCGRLRGVAASSARFRAITEGSASFCKVAEEGGARREQHDAISRMILQACVKLRDVSEDGGAALRVCGKFRKFAGGSPKLRTVTQGSATSRKAPGCSARLRKEAGRAGRGGRRAEGGERKVSGNSARLREGREVPGVREGPEGPEGPGGCGRFRKLAGGRVHSPSRPRPEALSRLPSSRSGGRARRSAFARHPPRGEPCQFGWTASHTTGARSSQAG